MTEPRICPRHETRFTPVRHNQIFCTPACKNAAHSEMTQFGKLMIDAGYLTRAQLRAVFRAVGAIGSIEAFVAQITASVPYTEGQSDG